MLNLKKVIALVCVFTLALSTVAFGATYTDVAEDSAYYEAVETLNKLGIVTGYEDGTFKPEDGVTRAEMAALIARIQGYGETAMGAANTAFTDVPASHWASGYIANAAGMGIINGYGDGTFGPEDPVLYEQAVKMVMATLGYTPYAEKNGGYPTGYLAAAQRYNVSLAVANAVVGQEANRGTVAQLLENALDTPLMIQSYWNTSGEVGYEIADGIDGRAYRTLMSENLGYVKIRGIVNENALVDYNAAKASINTSLVPEVEVKVFDSFGTTDKGYKNINSTTQPTGVAKDILVGDTDVEDYVGRAIVGYIKKLATDKYEFVSVAVDSNRNETLEITLDQFAGYDAGNTEIDYYKEGASDTTAAKLAGDIPLVFNNAGGYSASYLNTKISSLPSKFGGKITLIDNDTTKGYDVAFLDLAATAVVKKVTDNSIVLYNNARLGGLASGTKTIYVYPEDETKSVKIYKDGAEIDFAELNEWDVLSVYAENKTADVIVADVIANEVVGTISSTKSSKTSDFQVGGVDTAFKVGDAWYDVATGAYQEGLEIGAGGKFYIDEFGKIAAFVEDAALAGGAAGNYGYVLAVAGGENSFGSAGKVSVKVQMLTADGVEVLTIKNNAKLNVSGTTVTALPIADWTFVDGDTDGKVDAGEVKLADGTTTATAFDTLVDTSASATVVGKVVKYTKDASGNLSTITLAGHKKSATADAELTVAAGGTWTYDAESTKFMNGTSLASYIAADAKVFVAGDETTSKLVSAADLSDKNSYVVKGIYTTKNAEDVDIVVVTATSFNNVSITANLAVITAVSSAVDEATGAEILILTFFQDGEEKTLATTSDVYDADASWITTGDIVKIKTTDDVISAIDEVWDFTNDYVRASDIATSNSVAVGTHMSDNGNEAFYGGVVTAYKDSTEEATIEGTPIKLSKAVNFYEINNAGRELVITVEGGSTFANLSDALYDNAGVNVICDAKGTPVVRGTLVDDDNDDANDNGIKDATEGGAEEPATPKVWTGVADSAARAYADYVYVRTYEGKPVDVIVVKGANITVQ